MPIDKSDINLPKKSCDLRLAISLSQGKRIISTMIEEKLKRKMEEAEKKKGIGNEI